MSHDSLKAEEISILGCLRRDARMSVSDIAKATGMPISTARHRLNRMLKDGRADVGVLIDPFKIGYQIWAIFELQVELRRIEQVAERLAAEEQLYFIGITTGHFDIWAAGIFKSNEDLLEFISTRLARIEGIKTTSTSSILKLVKRNMAFNFASADGGIVPEPGVAPAPVPTPRRRRRSAS